MSNLVPAVSPVASRWSPQTVHQIVSRYPKITAKGLRLLLRLPDTKESQSKAAKLLRLAKKDLSLTVADRLNPEPSTPLRPRPLYQQAARANGTSLVPVAVPVDPPFFPEKIAGGYTPTAEELITNSLLVFEDPPISIGTPDSKGRLHAYHSDDVIEELIFTSPISHEIAVPQASNRHRGIK